MFRLFVINVEFYNKMKKELKREKLNSENYVSVQGSNKRGTSTENKKMYDLSYIRYQLIFQK